MQSSDAKMIRAGVVQRRGAAVWTSARVRPWRAGPARGCFERDATGNNSGSIRPLAAALISHSRFSFFSPQGLPGLPGVSGAAGYPGRQVQ